MFYDNLFNACSKNNLSVTKATQIIGVSKGNITRWKNGTNPTADIIVHFSELLNVSCDYLLTGAEPESIELFDDEKRLLNYYQKLNEDDKMKARGYIKELYERSEDEKFYEENAKLA